MFNQSPEASGYRALRSVLPVALTISALAFAGCAENDVPASPDHFKTETTQQNTTTFTLGEQEASITTVPKTTSTIEVTITSQDTIITEQITSTTSTTEAEATTPTSANVLPLLCPGMPDIRQNHTAPNCPPTTTSR